MESLIVPASQPEPRIEQPASGTRPARPQGR
jgi:hypothetical protein